MCITAGNEVLGFLELYGPVVGHILCIVAEYSAEEQVKRRRDKLRGLALHVKSFNGRANYSGNIANRQEIYYTIRVNR